MTKPQFVYVTYINSTPEKVFSALTDPEMTKEYWSRHRNASDWNVGSQWTHENYDDPTKVDIVGKVLESDPPRKLVISWEAGKPENRDPEPSRVTFLIEPFMESVKLTVTHENLEPGSKMLNGISNGWPVVLSSLKTMLETGDALAMTKKCWTGPPK